MGALNAYYMLHHAHRSTTASEWAVVFLISGALMGLLWWWVHWSSNRHLAKLQRERRY